MRSEDTACPKLAVLLVAAGPDAIVRQGNVDSGESKLLSTGMHICVHTDGCSCQMSTSSPVVMDAGLIRRQETLHSSSIH